MATSERIVTRHAALLYFALVFVISWGGVLFVLGGDGFSLSGENVESLPALLYPAVLAGPFLAGVLLTALAHGTRGLGDLLIRLRRWRIGWRWYAVALLPALVMTATALLLALVSSDFRPALLDAEDKAGVMTSALAAGLFVGIFEEIGWTGFAVPRLRARHSMLTTGLIVGAVWGAWHFPLFREPDSFSASLPLAILLVRLFSWLPALRVLLVWIHDRTGSLPVVMSMHAAVAFVTIALAPEARGPQLLAGLLVTAATMWLLLAAVIRTDRRLTTGADGAVTDIAEVL